MDAKSETVQAENRGGGAAKLISGATLTSAGGKAAPSAVPQQVRNCFPKSSGPSVSGDIHQTRRGEGGGGIIQKQRNTKRRANYCGSASTSLS